MEMVIAVFLGLTVMYIGRLLGEMVQAFYELSF